MYLVETVPVLSEGWSGKSDGTQPAPLEMTTEREPRRAECSPRATVTSP